MSAEHLERLTFENGSFPGARVIIPGMRASSLAGTQLAYRLREAERKKQCELTGWTDAGSVYAQLPSHKRNGFRKVIFSSRYESSQATNG